MTQPLVSLQDLSVQFCGNRTASALNQVSFELGAGEVLGLLGESGSGKSVTLRTLLRLYPERNIRISGHIRVDGKDVLALNGRELELYRGGTVSMVFQEPGLAFDPVYTIGQQITEAIRIHEAIDEGTARQQALHMLDRVQIPQAKQRFAAYPSELSGGMRQRAMIALALACKPKLLLADEPTTALDASVQIQILLLLRELQQETGMAVIFVTHDIGAAVEVSDRIAVMYAGRIVEQGPVGQIVRQPRHPYTAGLLASSVGMDNRGKNLLAVPGSPPNLASLPPGCSFAPRCTSASEQCRRELPPVQFRDNESLACFHPVLPFKEVA